MHYSLQATEIARQRQALRSPVNSNTLQFSERSSAQRLFVPWSLLLLALSEAFKMSPLCVALNL